MFWIFNVFRLELPQIVAGQICLVHQRSFALQLSTSTRFPAPQVDPDRRTHNLNFVDKPGLINSLQHEHSQDIVAFIEIITLMCD